MANFRTMRRWTSQDEERLSALVPLGPAPTFASIEKQYEGRHFYTNWARDELPAKPKFLSEKLREAQAHHSQSLADVSQIKNPASAAAYNDEVVALPLVQLLEASNQQIPGELRLTENAHAVYVLKHGVDLMPERGEKIKSLKVRYEYGGGEFLTMDLSPTTELEESVPLKAGGQLGIKVDGGLAFAMMHLLGGVPVAATMAPLGSGYLQLKGDWSYRRLQAKVVSLGKRSHHAEWRIHRPEGMIGLVEFCIILRAPKDATSMVVTLSGELGVKLPPRLRQIWKRDRILDITAPPKLTVRLKPG